MFRNSFSRKLTKVHLTSTVKSISIKCNDDYQYLSKSKIPTLHFQPSLPKLPIPELSKSLERYLNAQKPLICGEEYLSLEKLVNDFLLFDGPSLQKELKHNDSINKHTSYISSPWFEMYLKDRKPLPINYNPFLVFIDDPKPEYNNQLIRATNLVISSLRFMKSLRSNRLEPEVFHLNPKKSDTHLFRTVTGILPPSLSWYGAYLFKAFPLDMSQYENLFNTTRIPVKGIDRLYHDSSAKHIVVMKNGHIYKVNVLDDSGLIYEPFTIFKSLTCILCNKRKPAEYPVGVLTTDNRDQWAVTRNYLEQIGNEKVLNLIDSAIFNLIFDDEDPSTDYKTLVERYLHSDGTSRWFDKSFSLIIQKNGVAGLNFEHSWGDGVAVLRYFNDVYKDSTSNPQIHPHEALNTEVSNDKVQTLDFILDDASKGFICSSKEKYSKVCSTLGIELFEFLEFGRDLCKKHNISPDSLMQLAFQTAYYKLHRKFVSTYESCSTAAFKHGRTETMRPCTLQTKAIIEALLSNNVPNKADLLKMMNDCSFVHGNLIKEAAMGQGFDRHLFILKHLAEQKRKIPELFNSPLHHNFNYYLMSTSTLNSDALMLGAFGPVVHDGIGIGYSIWNSRLGAIVSYYKNHSDGVGYIQSLEDSLHLYYNILK